MNRRITTPPRAGESCCWCDRTATVYLRRLASEDASPAGDVALYEPACEDHRHYLDSYGICPELHLMPTAT